MATPMKAGDLLAERIHDEWAQIRRVIAFERGEGWEDALPGDLEVGTIGDVVPIDLEVGTIGDVLPILLVFRFADVGLDYLRAGDGGVFEYEWDGDEVHVTSWAANGERLRSLTTTPAEAAGS